MSLETVPIELTENDSVQGYCPFCGNLIDEVWYRGEDEYIDDRTGKMFFLTCNHCKKEIQMITFDICEGD